MKENNKIGYVYLTTNLVNGKQYVGQHLSDGFDKYYKGSGTYIKRALDKYGWDNFTCEVLQWCTTQTQLNEVEDNCIRLLGTMVPNGYNLKGGGANGRFSKEARKNMSEAHKGQVSWNKGKHHTEETRKNLSKGQQKRWEKTEEHKKISETLKKYFESEENRKKTAEATKKYYESEEGKLSRKKMSESQKKRFENPEERKKMSEAKKNPSEETRKKMSEAIKGRKRKPLSEETKQKISKANKGRVGAMTGKHHTEETRKKISEANKRNKNALGHRHTEETRKKISETEKGKVVSAETRKKLSKTVYQHTKCGEFIREWVSAIEIQNQLGFDHRNISACCRGKLKTFKGFKWSFELLN